MVPRCSTVEELADRSIGNLKKKSLVKKGDRIVIVAGEPVGSSRGVNLVEIKEVT
jgi:pyruvate kinase